MSLEADLAVFDDPDGELADRISGAIGELSSFDHSFGYHADGVGLETAILPAGWQERLIVFDPPDAEPGRGLCLEPHDCVVSKLVAGRPKDRAFTEALAADEQGKGYGRFAVEAVLAEARRRGADRATVLWVPGEDGPEGFYRRIGFERTGEEFHGQVVGSIAL